MNVVTVAKVSMEYEKSFVEQSKQQLWDYLKIIAGGGYLPPASESCCWCDFQDDCPAASRVVDFQKI